MLLSCIKCEQIWLLIVFLFATFVYTIYLYLIAQEEEVRPEDSVSIAMSSDASQHEVTDAEVQLIEQEKMLLHLKDMVRDCEQSLAAKDAELQVWLTLICFLLQGPTSHFRLINAEVCQLLLALFPEMTVASSSQIGDWYMWWDELSSLPWLQPSVKMAVTAVAWQLMTCLSQCRRNVTTSYWLFVPLVLWTESMGAYCACEFQFYFQIRS